MSITPGTYLRLRREAAFLTREDVADRFSTEPRWPSHVRVAWLQLLETDQTPASFATIVALQKVVPFSLAVLAALTIADPRTPVPALCRGCACSFYDPCIDQVELMTCRWVEVDLCSSCADRGVAHAPSLAVVA